MTESDLQQLLSNASNDTSSTDVFGQVLEPLLPMLSLFFIVSIVLTVVLVIAFIISSIQKHRTHKAILRIDANLQKLVDAQQSTKEELSSAQDIK